MLLLLIRINWQLSAEEYAKTDEHLSFDQNKNSEQGNKTKVSYILLIFIFTDLFSTHPSHSKCKGSK